MDLTTKSTNHADASADGADDPSRLPGDEWEQRVARARERRQQVLAERKQHGRTARPKPWETAHVMRGVAPQIDENDLAKEDDVAKDGATAPAATGSATATEKADAAFAPLDPGEPEPTLVPLKRAEPRDGDDPEMRAADKESVVAGTDDDSHPGDIAFRSLALAYEHDPHARYEVDALSDWEEARWPWRAIAMFVVGAAIGIGAGVYYAQSGDTEVAVAPGAQEPAPAETTETPVADTAATNTVTEAPADAAAPTKIEEIAALDTGSEAVATAQSVDVTAAPSAVTTPDDSGRTVLAALTPSAPDTVFNSDATEPPAPLVDETKSAALTADAPTVLDLESDTAPDAVVGGVPPEAASPEIVASLGSAITAPQFEDTVSLPVSPLTDAAPTTDAPALPSAQSDAVANIDATAPAPSATATVTDGGSAPELAAPATMASVDWTWQRSATSDPLAQTSLPDGIAALPEAATIALPQARTLTSPDAETVPDAGALPDLAERAPPPRTGAPVELAALVPDVVAPAEAPPEARPETFDANVIVHAPETVADEQVVDQVNSVVGAGFAETSLRRVSFTISNSNVRYFHDGDAEMASKVAASIGATLRDFTAFEPQPPTGTIEVWLAGAGNAATPVRTAAPAATPTRTRRAPAATTRQGPSAEQRRLNAAKQRIISRIRRGDAF